LDDCLLWAVSEIYRSNQHFYVLILKLSGLAYNLGDVFTNSSGHLDQKGLAHLMAHWTTPVILQHCTHALAPPISTAFFHEWYLNVFAIILCKYILDTFALHNLSVWSTSSSLKHSYHSTISFVRSR
jgi:hypothetical protein